MPIKGIVCRKYIFYEYRSEFFFVLHFKEGKYEDSIFFLRHKKRDHLNLNILYLIDIMDIYLNGICFSFSCIIRFSPLCEPRSKEDTQASGFMNRDSNFFVLW